MNFTKNLKKNMISSSVVIFCKKIDIIEIILGLAIFQYLLVVSIYML